MLIIYERVLESGILRDKTINNKVKYFPNDEKQNYPSVDNTYG